MTTTANSTDRLAELVNAKLQMLELLSQLAERQLALARGGAIPDLLKLLAGKQTVLVQLQQIERLLDPFRSEDADARPWRSAEDRRLCQQAASRCDELLAQTMRLEKLGENEMQHRREAAASALATAQSSADASLAYAGSPDPSPALAELHCEG
jgi:flagellar biosynthesis/type III secretory pathway chaperone